VTEFDRAVLDRVDDRQTGNDFPRSKRLNLEIPIGRLADGFGEDFRSALDGVERLRPTRRHAPLEGRRRLRNRGTRDRSGCQADTGRLKTLTTLHHLSSLLNLSGVTPLSP
jgi:hypothetical protein